MMVVQLQRTLLIALLLVVSGWNWNTHEAVTTSVALSHNGPELNLTLLRLGAIVPDKYFRDYRDHSLPGAMVQAERWLTHGKDAWNAGNRDEASFAFGIASHYLTDAFSSPHNIAGESYDDHAAYEGQAEKELRSVPCSPQTESWKALLADAPDAGNDWERWLETRDPAIAYGHIARAVPAVQAAYQWTFGTPCRAATTVAAARWSGQRMTMLLGIVIALIIVLAFLVKEFANHPPQRSEQS